MDEAAGRHKTGCASKDGCLTAEMKLLSDGKPPESPIFAIDVPGRILTELSDVLRPYDTDAVRFMRSMTAGINSQYYEPWALVLFRHEHPIVGTLAMARGLRERLPVFRYSRAPEPGTDGDNGAPMAGGFLLPSKATMMELAPRLPALEPIWSDLRVRDASTRWVCIAPDPDPAWVNRMAEKNQEDCDRALCRERDLMTEPGYERIGNAPLLFEALCALDEDDPFEALQLANRLLEAFPRHPTAQVVLGDAMAFQGDCDAALECYYEAIRLRKTTTTRKTNELRQKASEAKGLSHFRREVLAARSREIERESLLGAVRAWVRIIDHHKQSGNTDAELAACRSATCDFPLDYDLRRMLADVRERLGDVEGALKNLAMLVPDAGASEGECWYNMSRICCDQHRLGHALLCARKAAEVDPERAGAWSHLALVHTQRAEFYAGASCWTQALRLEGYDNGGLHHGLARCLLGLGEPRKALKSARMADEQMHTRDSRLTLAQAYLACNCYHRAAEILTSMLQRRWDDAEVWYGLGLCNVRSCQLDKARDVLKQLRTMDLVWAAELRALLESRTQRASAQLRG